MKYKTIFFLFIITNQVYSQWNEIGTLNGLEADETFGFSTSISGNGNTVLVGAPKFGTDDYGRCYVYEYNTTTWEQKGIALAGFSSSLFPGDYYGWSVSIDYDGSTLIVGGIKYFGFSGVCKIYEYSEINNLWSAEINLISGGTLYDRRGYSVSMSDNGSVSAFGTPAYSTLPNGNQGSDDDSVRLYDNLSGDWASTATIQGIEPGEQFGSSVSLNADGTIVAGGIQNTYYENDKGGVRVYRKIDEVWTQIGSDIYGKDNNDTSDVVSLNDAGNILAIGSRYNDDGGTNAGHVRIFKNENDVWVQIGDAIEGENAGDGFGTSISINGQGNIIAIGAPQNHDNITDKGYVGVFENINDQWVQLDELILGGEDDDAFGFTVSLSTNGNKLVVGAPYNDVNGSNSGQVKVYQNENSLAVSDQEIINNSLKIYPNPSFENVCLSIENNTLKSVQIFNIYGALITSNEINNTNFCLNISSISSGAYVLKVEIDKGVVYKKIIKE